MNLPWFKRTHWVNIDNVAFVEDNDDHTTIRFNCDHAIKLKATKDEVMAVLKEMNPERLPHILQNQEYGTPAHPVDGKVVCPRCGGKGYTLVKNLLESTCVHCHGKGYYFPAVHCHKCGETNSHDKPCACHRISGGPGSEDTPQ